MVFHPQEFGNVATCCAYLEGAGLGPGAAVARSDGVAWRRVSINYSHNYSRRPAASRCSPSPSCLAISASRSASRIAMQRVECALEHVKGEGVSLHGIYQTSYWGEGFFILRWGSIGINDLETCSTILFFDRGFCLSWLSRVIAWRGSPCNVIMTNSTKGEWGKSGFCDDSWWFEDWKGDDFFINFAFRILLFKFVFYFILLIN